MKQTLLVILLLMTTWAFPAEANPTELQILLQQRERLVQDLKTLKRRSSSRAASLVARQIKLQEEAILNLDLRIARLQARLDRETEKERERTEKAILQETDRRSRELEQQLEEARKRAEAQDLLPIAQQELQEWERYAQQIQIEYNLGLASSSQLLSVQSRIRSQLEKVTQLEHRLNPRVNEEAPDR